MNPRPTRFTPCEFIINDEIQIHPDAYLEALNRIKKN